MMDIHLALRQLGMSNNTYKLSNDVPPHEILEWYGPDSQPTEEELRAAWETCKAKINVPETIDMRRARLALLQAGLLDTVEAAIAAMSGTEGKAARIEWEYATTIRRNHPLVKQLQGALSLTDEQMAQLFIDASNLE